MLLAPALEEGLERAALGFRVTEKHYPIQDKYPIVILQVVLDGEVFALFFVVYRQNEFLMPGANLATWIVGL